MWGVTLFHFNLVVPAWQKGKLPAQIPKSKLNIKKYSKLLMGGKVLIICKTEYLIPLNMRYQHWENTVIMMITNAVRSVGDADARKKDVHILIHSGPWHCWVLTFLNRSFTYEQSAVSDDELGLRKERLNKRFWWLKQSSVKMTSWLCMLNTKWNISGITLHKSFTKLGVLYLRTNRTLMHLKKEIYQ